MERLSTEVLIPIFFQLDTSSKLECILVCKKWHSIITRNILYKQLKFKNMVNFNKAIHLFNKNQEFGQLVEVLIIENFELDIFSIIFMPTKFPNIRALNWSEVRRSPQQYRLINISPKELPSPQIYKYELSKWKKIRSIKTSIERLPFTIMLLESSIFINLTHLDVSFYPLFIDDYFNQTTILRIRPIVKLLIKNIKNAPVLQELCLECPVLDLNDMEELHDHAPKLEKITFYCSEISGNTNINDNIKLSTNRKTLLDSDGVEIVQNAASRVKYFEIEFFLDILQGSAHNVSGALKSIMIKWLTYMSCKYNQVDHLMLKGWRFGYLPRIPEFEQPILKIISNISHISTYHASLYPITKSIMDAIDKKEGELKELYIYSNTLEEIETQLNHVKSSRHAIKIVCLNIDAKYLYIRSHTIFTSIISGILTEFFCLTNLVLTSNIYYSALVEILHGLPNLLSLTTRSVHIDDTENIVIALVVPCSLQIFRITLFCDINSNSDKLNQVNQVIEFILLSCSFMREFTLEGDLSMAGNGVLNISFLNHEQLKIVNINIKEVQNYLFTWQNEKSEPECAEYKKPVETGSKLFVAIAWKTQNIQLNLEKTPTKIDQ